MRRISAFFYFDTSFRGCGPNNPLIFFCNFRKFVLTKYQENLSFKESVFLELL